MINLVTLSVISFAAGSVFGICVWIMAAGFYKGLVKVPSIFVCDEDVS